jgi:hypothetical protein
MRDHSNMWICPGKTRQILSPTTGTILIRARNVPSNPQATSASWGVMAPKIGMQNGFGKAMELVLATERRWPLHDDGMELFDVVVGL